MTFGQALTQVKKETCAVWQVWHRHRWWRILHSVFSVTVCWHACFLCCLVLEDSIIPFLSFCILHLATLLTVGIIHTGFQNKRSSIEALSVSILFRMTKFSKHPKKSSYFELNGRMKQISWLQDFPVLWTQWTGWYSLIQHSMECDNNNVVGKTSNVFKYTCEGKGLPKIKIKLEPLPKYDSPFLANIFLSLHSRTTVLSQITLPRKPLFRLLVQKNWSLPNVLCEVQCLSGSKELWGKCGLCMFYFPLQKAADIRRLRRQFRECGF